MLQQRAIWATIGNLTKTLPAALLALNLSGCSTMNPAPASGGRVETEVLAAFKELVDASKALDAKRYFACFDPERFTGLNADGKVWHSMKEFENTVAPGFAAVDKVVSLEFSRVKVNVLNPSTAVLVNEYAETVLLKNGTTIKHAGGGVQVWSKERNAWKLVSVSASDASQ
jgi:hypothetical protein